MPRFAEFSDVVIATDRFEERGVRRGSPAVVLEVYDDGGYELQIFDDHGETIGQFSAHASDLEAVSVETPR